MRNIGARRMAWAVLPVAGVLALAGCSDDKKDDSKASNSPAAQTPAATTGAPAAPTSAPASAPAAVNSATFTADQKAAAAAYQKVLDPKATVAERKALIQDADKLNTMLDAMLSSQLVSSVSIKTNDVKIDGDKGTVNFDILLGGAAGAVPPIDGNVVKQDGTWKVGGKTVCTLAGYAQVPPAAECSGY
ncbi:hypothetical protein GCM10023205_13170 [Yinghuangia aomiensis]|uniref:Low molecular weight antigen MTB12-like C-terminal domain-containing protein n=1 Tax=Yinghuangia aomiensis TaxID=676205 RepID=A0ABP9GXE1_9ACTN